MSEMRLNRGLFVSHAHSDQELIAALKKLIDDVFAHHFDVFATSVVPIEGGDHWRDEIRLNLDKADVVLVVITPQSIQKEWLLFEAGAAWLDAALKQKKLIPCRFKYDDFSSPLSEFMGVDLLDLRSIETVLLSALSRVSGLRPSDRFQRMAIEEFLNTISKLPIQASEEEKNNLSLRDVNTRIDMLLDCIIEFFKDNPDEGLKFARMLLYRGVFIDQDKFEKIQLEVYAKD